MIFSGKLKTEIKSNLRTFEQIWNGETNDSSETVLYCVEKYDAESQNLLQKYWFPNSNEIDVINFVDTQVVYDKRYTYRAVAYQLAFGEEYDYQRLQIRPDDINVTIVQACEDLPLIRLGGLECLQEPTPTQVAQCVFNDAQKLYENVLPILNEKYPGMSIADGIVIAYVTYGEISSFLSPIYLALFCQAMRELGAVPDAMGLYNTIMEKIQLYNRGELSVPELGVPDVQVDVDNNYLARVFVTTRPAVKLVKVPYFTRSGFIVDSPPVFPDVQIYPYKGKNDRLLIWLNSNIGEYELYPVTIEDSDEQQIRKIREKNNLRPSDPILYKTDDHVQSFQVYRVLSKPESYRDFKDQLIAELNTNEVIRTSDERLANFRASSTSYVDRVEPNTKYYYMFRTVDVHGHVSYPSSVYEVEMVDNDGAVFPLIKIVPVEERETPYDMQKTGRRHIHIVPRITQGTLNESKSGLSTDSLSATSATSYVLGVEDETLWGKKFKIRMTSKSTNKKVDINVQFKTKHVVSNEEDEIRKSGIATAGLTEEERVAYNVDRYYEAYRYYAENGSIPDNLRRRTAARRRDSGSSVDFLIDQQEPEHAEAQRAHPPQAVAIAVVVAAIEYIRFNRAITK